MGEDCTRSLLRAGRHGESDKGTADGSVCGPHVDPEAGGESTAVVFLGVRLRDDGDVATGGTGGDEAGAGAELDLRVRLLKIGAQVRSRRARSGCRFPRATPMRRCCRRFWRKCKPIRFAVSENQPYGKRPVGSSRDGLCPGIGSWGRNVAHECRWEVKCPCASPDFGFHQRIRVGKRALEFIWIRKPLNCVKPTDYRVGVEKCGLGQRKKCETKKYKWKCHDLFLQAS